MNNRMKYPLLIALLTTLLIPLTATGESNILKNSSFELESQGFIEMWYTDAYDKTAEAVRVFQYSEVVKAGTFSLGVANLKLNDTKVIQWATVEPDALYHISGWVQAKDVTGGKIGANLSVIGTTRISAQYRDTGDEWQYVEFYGKTGPRQTSLGIVARLGFFGSLVEGYAFFDELSLTHVASSPVDKVLHFADDIYISVKPGDPVILDSEPQTEPPAPGRQWTPLRILLMAVAVLAGVALLLFVIRWIIFSGLLKRPPPPPQVAEGTDRRRTVRRIKRLPVVIKKHARKGILIESHLKCRDISLSGIFVVTEDISLYNLDETLELKIGLKKDQEIEARAKVIRSEVAYGKNGEEQMNGYGLHFTLMEEADRKKLEAFFSLIPKSSPKKK